MELITLWKLLAGIAFFLWGMQTIEEALKFLSSRRFKLFLKKLSASRIKSILGGTLASMVMQSSSLVNMMILAFVASEVIQMKNALALILGSNLGTTLNNWILLWVGFKMEVSSVAYALVGLFGFIWFISKPGKKINHWSKFIFGLGVILIGLNLVKTAMEQFTSTFNLSVFNHYPLIVFLVLGFVITAVLQASSATVIIVLSALNAGAIPLLAGMAMVLGSEVGTTIKFLLISIKGIPDKKRVAVGNVSFNIICALLVFIFLQPVDVLIQKVIGIADPLIAVVFFQTLINIISILIFSPFLRPISELLNKLFVQGSQSLLRIQEVKANDTGNAILAIEEDIDFFLHCALRFTRFSFELPPDRMKGNTLPKIFRRKNNLEQYEYVKTVHGEIHLYAHRVLSENTLNPAQESRLNQLMTANRNTMYACKNIKDAFDDLHTLRQSSNDVKFGFYKNASKQMNDFLKTIQTLLKENDSKEMFKQIKALYQS
ncbi:MAG TPA: Na/Pi symporter, partial [Saprospiraceae bacterium]|nr:Na/Pi symporter [Saprospiraceae bacterium]